MSKLVKRGTIGTAAAGLVLGIGVWYGMQPRAYHPKPVGYPRIELPLPLYQPLTLNVPYHFEISQLARAQPSPAAAAEPYWIDILYPAFDAVVQITYKAVEDDASRLQSYCQDAHKLALKHRSRASGMREELYQTPRGSSIVLIEIGGQVPSPVQFYTTDARRHFLRGALYFNTACQNDYLQPVVEFIKADLRHLFDTLTWRTLPQDDKV